MQQVDLEQLVKSLTVSNERNCSTGSQTTTEQQTFSAHERDVTGYLFAKLAVLYANLFYLVYPSLKEVDFAKREYAKQIGKFSREQIDIGLQQLARLAISRERDDRIYREPNIPAFLALTEEVAKRDRAHQVFLPAPIESEEQKAARIQAGVEKPEYLAFVSMFSEEPKQPTAEDIADNERLEKIRGGN